MNEEWVDVKNATSTTKRGTWYYRRLPPTTTLDPIYRTQPCPTGSPGPITTALIHLRPDHGASRQYLHCIQKLETPDCFCRKQAPQTLQHLLLECPAFLTPRAHLQRLLTPAPLNNSTIHTCKGSAHILEYTKATRIGPRGWDPVQTRNEESEDERWWAHNVGDGRVASLIKEIVEEEREGEESSLPIVAFSLSTFSFVYGSFRFYQYLLPIRDLQLKAHKPQPPP